MWLVDEQTTSSFVPNTMETTRSTALLLYSEFIGTALMLTAGLSFVIFLWGTGSPMIHLIPSASARRIITGFLFGSSGCLVSLSPVGKISGAHINPAVSVAFWLRGKMTGRMMLFYVASQMAGAVVGCLPLLLWGQQGVSIHYGNTEPGSLGVLMAFGGEVLATATLITMLFVFGGSVRFRAYTPYAIPFLYSFLVWIESPLSGCSTNPARSFGPAVVSGVFREYWLYVAAPLLGVLLVVGFFRLLRLHLYFRLKSARVCYHDLPTHPDLMTKEPA